MAINGKNGDLAAASDHNDNNDAKASSLLARIAALEAENRQLREQLSSALLLSFKKDGGTRRRSSVYFDGFKTRLDDDEHDEALYDANNQKSERSEPCCDQSGENKGEQSSSRRSGDVTYSLSTSNTLLAQSRLSSSSFEISSSKGNIYNNSGPSYFKLGENRYTKRADERFNEILKTSVNSLKQSMETHEGENRGDDDSRAGFSMEERRTKSESGLLSSSSTYDNLVSGLERHSSVNDMNSALFAVPRGVQLFMRIHAMSKRFSSRASLPTGSLIKSSQERLLYDQFAILSLDPTCGRFQNLSSWSDPGCSFLDAFVLKTPNCIDSYPIQLAGEGFVPEELSAFCCLDGVQVRMMSESAVAGAMRTGSWFKDEHKLLAFTDGNGVTTFGIAITVYQEVTDDEDGYNELVDFLQNRRRTRAATRLITRWWRLHANKRERTNVDAKDQSKKIGRSTAEMSPKLTNRMKNLMPNRRQRNRSEGSAFYQSVQGGMKKVKDKFTRVTISGMPSDDLESKSSITPPKTLPLSEQNSSSAKPTSTAISGKTRLRAKESFDMMVSERDVILAQKCYIMIGGDQRQQFLQLLLLKHLIEMELKGIDNGEGDESGFHGSGRRRSLQFLPKDKTIRRKFLQVIRRLHLSRKQARIRLPSEDVDILRQPPPTFNIELPAFDWVSQISIPLPLPHVVNDWGVAQLFLFLKPECICAILKLLLVERSLLVIGQSSEVVTSSTLALMELIRPFTWASNFLPLLPMDLLDFVSSPVPFVAGMVCNDIKIAQIIERDEVKDAMREGLSVVNLNQGNLFVATEKGIRDIVEQSPAPIQQLSSFKYRLELLRDRDDCSLASFDLFLKNGLSRTELVTLNAIRNCIKAYVMGFSGSISSGEWYRFGKYNDGQFDFYPSLFIQPLRAQLQLQEMLCHSQLFIEYVNRKECASREIAELSKSDVGKFIAAFVYFHWRRRKRIAAKELKDSLG